MTIYSFQGEFRWLSNFWPAKVWLDGVEYPTVEHAYVAAKTLDIDARAQIASMDNPGAVKHFGRRLLLRSDWDAVKLSVMEHLLYQKFQHSELRDNLIATGERELIEGNSWGDTFWGICLGVGQNHLGRLLMQIRSTLKQG